jgi:ribonuclease P protein component
MDNTFKKEEKLKHKKLIAQLFKQGHAITVFPFRLIYLNQDFIGNTPIKIGFTVAKRNIKLAIKRNTIKRRMREAYRLNKHNLLASNPKKHIAMVIYLDKTILPSKTMRLKMEVLLSQFIEKLNKD